MDNKSKEVADLLKVLANEYRLLILCFLIEKPSTVNEIIQHIEKLSQSAVSQHLSLMKVNGILESKKNGLHITYSIKDQRVSEIIGTLRKYYCN